MLGAASEFLTTVALRSLLQFPAIESTVALDIVYEDILISSCPPDTDKPSKRVHRLPLRQLGCALCFRLQLSGLLNAWQVLFR